MAAIKDPEVKLPRKVHRPEPSVITDLGNRMYATRIRRAIRPTAPRSISSGRLNKELFQVKARRGALGQFCPNTDVLALINEDSVVEELKRQQNSLQSLKQSGSRYDQSSYSRFLSLPSRAIKASKSFGSSVLPFPSEASSDKITSQARQICGTQAAGNTRQRLSEPVKPTFRKIFAILVMMEMPLKIKRFLRDSVCDEDLPLTGRWIASQFKLFRRIPTSKLFSERATLQKPLRCFRGWKSSQRKKFEETQWEVVAPFFTRGKPSDLGPVLHYRIQSQAVLPFDSWEPVEPSGAFSQVFKTEIHEGHHDFQCAAVLTMPLYRD